MNFFSAGLSLAVCAWLCPLLNAQDAKIAKPNFLIILTDDQGYGDVSVYGQSGIQTPNIDRIGKEGMLFTAMRSNCTVCSPSRAALLTGRYADRVGVPGVIRTRSENSWGYFDPKVPTLADELKKVGYHTAIVGKWHLGIESPNLPNERGFDLFHGFLGDMMDDYIKCTRDGKNFLRLNQEVVQPTRHATDMFTDWAIDYLKQRKQEPDKPFFLYLAYNAPHFPIEPPKEWVEKVRKREPNMSKARTSSVAFVEHLDDAVGRVLKALDENGLAANTVVVFAADNGGSLSHDQCNDPWRGGKQDHYDGGVRVPFMLRWPDLVKPGGRSDYQGLVFDVFPTFLELVHAKPSPELDAVNLMPLLRGEAMPSGRELYFVRREGGSYGGGSYHALIADSWKLMSNTPKGPLELYNLAEDPSEKNNLAAQEADKLKSMTDRMQRHIQRGEATLWKKP